MKTYYGFILLLFFSSKPFAQGNDKSNGYDFIARTAHTQDNGNTKIVVKSNGDTTLEAYYVSKELVNSLHQEFTKTYKGTPFFRNGWYKGVVKIQNEQSKEFLMAYNVQKSEVYVIGDNKGNTVTLRPESFTIAGHHFSKFNNAYYEIIYISKNTILKEHSCTMSRNEKTGYNVSGGVGEYEGEFSKTSKYLLLRDDEPVKMPKNKKFLELFGEKKPLVEQYIKVNKINLKSENGIVSTLKYFDSLENKQ